MNIFILSRDPFICAREHTDAHVNKMLLETAQMLSTVNYIYGTHNGNMYRATHLRHPCTVWAGSSIKNYLWLYDLYLALGEEFLKRRGKIHKSSYIDKAFINSGILKSKIPKIGKTQFVQAIPDLYKRADPVKAYRNYYLAEKMWYWKNKKDHSKGKVYATWSKRPVPNWILSELVIADPLTFENII